MNPSSYICMAVIAVAELVIFSWPNWTSCVFIRRSWLSGRRNKVLGVDSASIDRLSIPE